MVRSSRRKTMRRMSQANGQPQKAKWSESLTGREQEILELIWAGFKNKEIGPQLKISVKTVEAHRSNMMKKMRVANTAELLRTAIDNAMIRVGVA
jgi:DNA-binding NarL/FixJ family response regulator